MNKKENMMKVERSMKSFTYHDVLLAHSTQYLQVYSSAETKLSAVTNLISDVS